MADHHVPPAANMGQRVRALKLAFSWCFRAAPWLMSLALFLAVFVGVLALAGPYVMKRLLDTLAGPNINPALVTTGAILGLFGLIYALNFLRGISWETLNVIRRAVGHRIDQKVRYDEMAKASLLDVSYSEEPKYHEALQRAASSMWRIQDTFWTLTWLGSEFIAAVAIVGVLFAFDWRIVAIIVLGCVPSVFFAFHLSSVLWSAFDQSSPIARRAAYYQDIITRRPRAMRDITMLGLREMLLGRFWNLFTDFIKEEDRAARKQMLTLVMSVLIEKATALLAAWLIVVSFKAGGVTAGTLAMLWAMLWDFAEHVKFGVRQVGDLNTHALFLQPLLSVLDFQPKIAEPERPKPLDGPIRKVELQGVSHVYTGKTVPSLSGVSLTISDGECIALVGMNGGGKSTLVKLLCRLYDPTEGAVLVNGVDAREVSLADLKRRTAVLFQDYFSFEAPVEENIKYGAWDHADEKRIREAATRAGADFIDELPKGYQTHLGRTIDTEGVELSGGQWQKVALARTFYRDAELLILDEPTAAIDAQAEEALFREFKEFARGRMSVIISHRFSTVRMADRIIVLDKGRVIEQGTHEELMALDGKYATLFHLQAKGYAEAEPDDTYLELGGNG